MISLTSEEIIISYSVYTAMMKVGDSTVLCFLTTNEHIFCHNFVFKINNLFGLKINKLFI